MGATGLEFPGLSDPHAPVWRTAQGEQLTTRDGRELVDLAFLFGAAIHGHGALQLSTTGMPTGLGDLQTSELRVRAAGRLCALTAAAMGDTARGDELRAVVLQSGSEAVETALKTALRATGRDRIVAFEGGYHGTFGLALAATHGARFREPFAAQYAGTVRWHPYGEVPQLDERDACVIVEPLLGRGGVVEPPPSFLADLRAACDAAGALLVVDSVLVGSGRTGVPLEGAACGPDLVCLGKALGAGLPASAVVGRAAAVERAWGDVRGEAIHTATFVGHPLSCAAALEALDRLEAGAIDAAAGLWSATAQRIARDTSLRVRGRGLLWALDTGTPGGGVALAATLLESGLVVAPSAPDGSCVTLTPATCSSAATADRLVAALATALPA